MPAAAAAVVAAAAATLTSSLTRLSTPRAWTNITWHNPAAASGDWLTIRCSGSSTYFSWTYTSGAVSGTQLYQLFSGGHAQSACSAINVALYSGGSVVAATADIPVGPMIQQIHISMNDDPSVMVVDWVSTAAGSAPACSYGETPALGSTARGNATAFSTIGSVSYALLTGLKPATTYYYACTDGLVTSETHSFVNRPANPTSRIAVWADFGVDDGFGLDQIAADVDAGKFDYILHAGDWAYNFESAQSASELKPRLPSLSRFSLTFDCPPAARPPAPP